MDRLAKKSLGTLSPISDGGQGVVFRVLGLRPKANGKPVPLVYKEYKPAARQHLDISVLEELARLRDSLTGADRARLVSRTAFPLHLVTENAAVTGFTMVEVPGQFFHVMQFHRGPTRTLGEVQHLLQSERILADRGLAVTDRLRAEFLRDVAGTLDFFHRHGLVVGDLSAKNLLFRLSGKVRCFFLDCDSMVLHGRGALPLVETPEWDVPAGEKAVTPASDLYKFGLLATRLFTGDQQARDARLARWPDTGLRKLAQSDLAAAPAARKTASDWLPALDHAIPRTSATPPARTAAPAPALAAVAPFQPPPMPAPHPRPHLPPQPPQVPARSRPRARWLLTGAASLAAVGAIAVFAVSYAVHNPPGGPTVSSPSASAAADPHEEAAAVNHVLKSSAGSREALAGAVRRAGRCSHLGSDVTAIRRAERQRASQVAAVHALQTAALPHGTALKSQLSAALIYSRRADRDFLTWARHLRSAGCAAPVRAGSAYSAAVRNSGKATAAKKAFVRRWNPIARQQGFPARSEPGI